MKYNGPGLARLFSMLHLPSYACTPEELMQKAEEVAKTITGWPMATRPRAIDCTPTAGAATADLYP